MVLITGVIKNTDGTPYMGSVKFALNDLGIESNTVYLPTVVTVESDGTFTVDLWPNTNSLTSSYYKCSLDNGSVFNISIPGNNPSYNLGDVILIDPGTLDSGILRRLNQIESGITTRVGDLEHYTGIADNRIPSIAISGNYPNAVAGKVSKTLTIGDGLTGGTYRGDTDVTIAVDGTVIRDTDARLSDAREWVAQTAPLEVVSQPTNNTRYAWTPQRIWDTIVSWFSTITSDAIPEGGNNLYYTDSRVANNPAVQTNTTKVSATGSVTTHNDITSPGSGQIITTPERTKLSNIEDNAQVNTVDSVVGKTGNVVLNSSDVGLGNVPNINTTNANNITSGTLSGSRLSYGTVANTPAQGDDSRFFNSREWAAPTVTFAEAVAGADDFRRAWTAARVRAAIDSITVPSTGGTFSGAVNVEGVLTTDFLYFRSGFENTPIGTDTLAKNTNGSKNVAVGYQSLQENTTGSSNTALGHSALHTNTSGSFNSAFGFSALFSNTTGVFNTAFGSSALFSNTTGDFNSAFGFDSLSNNTIGKNNSAFGFESLRQNSNGSGNCAFGFRSLTRNKTGLDNVSLGVNSMLSNIGGSNNVALGKDSLQFNEVGTNNTSVGFQSGYKSLGSNNIFLGNKAGFNEIGSGKLYISNSNTNTPLIYGDFSTKDLQINGDLTVAENLEVVGAIESSTLEVSNNATISGLLKSSRLNSLNITLNNTVKNISPPATRGIFVIAFTGTSNNSSNTNHQMDSSGLIAYDVGSIKFLSVLTSNSNGLIVVGENDPAGELQTNKIVVGVADGALRLRSTWDENTLTSITFIV